MGGAAGSLLLIAPAVADPLRLAQSQTAVAPSPQPAARPSAEPTEAAPGKALQTIVVLGQRTPARIARQAQKEAPNLINVQTYQEIRKLPDITTAEAVRRIPGISLEIDEGEGRYVNIRGFDADLNSTTFGGLRLPPTNNASPFGGYRAVTLDSIPVGLIGALTVTKSNTPSMDAEALGGTIEITPKTVPLDRPFYIQGNVGTGYEPLRNTGIADTSVTTGGRWGPFSLQLTGTYYEDSRGIDDVEPSYFNDSAHPYQAINVIQQRDYELNRWRHAYGFDFGYNPDPDDSWYLRGFDAGYTERYDRQILQISPDGNTGTNPGGNLLTDTLNNSGALQKQLRDEKETSIDRIITAGGRNVFTDDILDYHVGYTIGTYHKPYDFNSAFYFNPPAGSNGTIVYGPYGEGHTPIYTIGGLGNYNNPNAYTLNSFANSKADNYDRELSFAANDEHHLPWWGIDDQSIKFGVSVRLRHKLTTAQPLSYDNLAPTTLGSITDSGNETYYDGQYQNGYDIPQTYLQHVYGPGSIRALSDNRGITDPALYSQLVPANQIGADQQYLNARENVYAGYGQYQATFGKLHVLAGVRVESTVDKSSAYATLANAPFPAAITAAYGTLLPDGTTQYNFPDGSSVNSTATGYTTATRFSRSTSYTNVFPSIQFRYEIEPNLIARLAWSSTIARPGFNQSNPALSVDLGSGIVATGNPNLQPATANSIDIDIEKYLGDAGIISVGFFDKEISNYIVTRLLTSSAGIVNFPGIPPNIPLKITTYVNAPSSYARGIEFNYDQHFRFLPGWLGGFGASANYTFVDSSFEIRPGETALLPSTSQHTWNLALFYERYGFTARLAAYSASADLFAIGADKTGDVYNAERTFLDFGSSYRFSPHWVGYFNAKNLLNTRHAFYQQTESRPIQREFYDQTYQIGVRFDY